MRVDSLFVKNFKCFEERKFAFPEGFTLVVGENGVGKTALTEALAISIANGFDITPTNHPGINLGDKFVRVVRHDHGSATRFEPAGRVGVKASFTSDGDILCSSQGDVPDRSGNTLLGRIDRLANRFDQTALIFAYYSANRLPEERNQEANAPRPRSRTHRADVYSQCLAGHFAIPDILGWLRDEQYASLQEGQPSVLFKTVTDAMVSCLLGAKKIEYVVREYDVLVEFEDGDVQPFRNLSDGQRTMLWLAADIAYRSAWLNPHLDDRVLQETDGIVLIDKLDLHLHPKWQRRVVDDLKRTFPKIQFIATSHSPFIIQSLQPGELLSLDREPPIEYANRGLEEIARYVQGVDMPHTSERYVVQKEAAKKYFTLLREGRQAGDPELMAAKSDLDSLTAHFADNPAADAFLELQRAAANGDPQP